MDKLKRVLQEKYGTDRITTASIGGSATWGKRWPEDISKDGEQAVVARFDGFVTPFGTTGPMKLVDVCGVPVLRVPSHGWRFDDPTHVLGAYDSLAVFWVLQAIGVGQVISDGSVGGITSRQWDVVIVNDYVDLHSGPVVSQFNNTEVGITSTVRAARPYCPRMRAITLAAAEGVTKSASDRCRLGDIIGEGTYVNTLPGPFETAAEIEWYRRLGGDVVGRTGGQEAMLARICRMCFVGVYIVSNWAEGLSRNVPEMSMADFYGECAYPMGLVVMAALQQLVKQSRDCKCDVIGIQTQFEYPVPGA